MKSLYIFAAYMLIAACFPVAYGQNITKEKKVSGRFSADRGKLVIDNQYGKLDINTWDRNEVTVEIVITAKANSEGKAQEMLDKVNIVEPGAGGDIRYKTLIGKGKSFTTKGEFRIDYSINMPRRHTAEFTNKFGDIVMTDVDGKLTIDLQYGALKTGAIRGQEKSIKVDFGSAVIASVDAGAIRSSYSSLSISKAGNLSVSNQFGKTDIGSVRDLDIDQKYGDLKLNSVSQLRGNVQFAGVVVGRLQKSAQLTLEHCSGAKFEHVQSEVDNLVIDADFSNLSFHFEEGAGMTANITQSFGRMSTKGSGLSLAEAKVDNVGQNATYRGKLGSGRGNMTLKVTYGNITFK